MEFTRRDVLKAGAAVSALGMGLAPPAFAADLHLEPEKGAELRILRWKKFVQGDEDGWMANT